MRAQEAIDGGQLYEVSLQLHLVVGLVLEIYHVATFIAQVEEALLRADVELIGWDDFEWRVPSIALCVDEQVDHEFRPSDCLDE